MHHAIEFSATVMAKHSKLFHKINYAMSEGQPFAECLKPYVKFNLYFQLLLAEEHGDLEDCLQKIGKVMVLREKQQQKLLTLLQYPLILLALLAGLLAVLKIYVFPELTQWGADEGNIGSRFLSLLSYFLGGLLILLISFLMRWRKLDQLQRVNFRCSLPVFGKCYRLFYGYYVLTNLAMMVQHGLTIKEICMVVSRRRGRGFMQLLGKITQDEVRQGHDLKQIFQQAPFLPRELLVMIGKGETREELGADLAVLADILFQRLTQRIERLLALVQPIIFGLVALVIVGLYLRILLPIYHSMQGVI